MTRLTRVSVGTTVGTMATLFKRARSPYWQVAYFTSDGARHYKSTKFKDKKQAQEFAGTLEKANGLAATGRLTPAAARELVASAVSGIYAVANQEDMPRQSVRQWLTSWLDTKQVESQPTTLVRYRGIVERFLAFLGAKADKDIVSITPAEVGRFRDRMAKELSRNSANLGVKVLRAALNGAAKQGLITSNPAAVVDKLKVRGESKRRPFTAAELRRVLQACGDTDWRGMVLFGIYTGARLGDIARLTWRAVDLQTKEVAFTTGKTGRRMILPLAKPLRDYLESLPSTENPDAPIFQQASASAKWTGTLSNGFYEVLVSAGLAEPRTKQSTGKGRNASRPVGELSFHSLRHSATTFLKAAGVSDALAREIIGHDSAAISRGYTHLSTEDLRTAMDKLPDITKAAK